MVTAGACTLNLNAIKDKAWNLGDQVSSFSFPFISSTIGIASYMEPTLIPLALNNANLKSGYNCGGIDITQSLLNQSLEYFQKALYNFNLHYLLAERGYSTWAGVTNYYSSYFSIFSLLALQGRAITRIKLDGINETTCLLHPVDFRNHIYVLTTTENGGTSHKLPWRKYYNIYDQYNCIKPEFDIVQSKHFVTDPEDESDNRNKVNYKIFEGFKEVADVNNLVSFRNDYLAALSSPVLGSSIQDYIHSLMPWLLIRNSNILLVQDLD